MPVVHVSADRRGEITRLIRNLPGMLAGRVPDVHGIAAGFKTRMAFAFFSIIKENFIIKARGGTDEAGIKWAPLSAAYLAYQRPMGRSPGVGSRKPPHAGRLAPGGNDGFMSKAELQQWRRDYARTLAYLLLHGLDEREAKGKAAASAWTKAKARGVKTKLAVFGTREVEIGRDRGIMFNSLSPGVVLEDGPTATYTPPSDEQIYEPDNPGVLIVGTNCQYAEWFHARRPLWPADGQLPDAWLVEVMEAGASGLMRIVEIFL